MTSPRTCQHGKFNLLKSKRKYFCCVAIGYVLTISIFVVSMHLVHRSKAAWQLQAIGGLGNVIRGLRVQGQFDQFAALNNIGWEAALVLADGAEQFGRLELETAKVLHQAATGTARSLSGLAEAAPNNASGRGSKTAASYSRDAYDIASRTQVRLLVLLQASSTELMKGLTQAATQSVQLVDAAVKAAASAAAQTTRVDAASKG